MKNAALFLVVLALLAPTAARAQQAELDNLAARVAKHIQKKKKKRVYVRPFRGKYGTLSALGDELTRTFRQSLARSPGIEIVDESELIPIVTKLGLSPLWTYPLVPVVAPAVGAELLVHGFVEPQGGAFRLTLTLTDAQSQRDLEEEAASFVVPSAPAAADEPVMDPGSGAYVAGVGGVSYAECMRCPNPDYSPAARSKGIQGRMAFLVTVSTEGRIIDILILQTLEPSLDKQAVEALATWKLRPARGPGGKPVPSRQAVEMTFRIR